jgi:hypothetical protein
MAAGKSIKKRGCHSGRSGPGFARVARAGNQYTPHHPMDAPSGKRRKNSDTGVY